MRIVFRMAGLKEYEGPTPTSHAHANDMAGHALDNGLDLFMTFARPAKAGMGATIPPEFVDSVRIENGDNTCIVRRAAG